MRHRFEVFRCLGFSCAAFAALAVGLFPGASQAATTLDPNNPNATFTVDGGQTFTSGTTLTLSDTNTSDFIVFFAVDPDANPGSEIDIIATFQIRQYTRNNADVGNRIVINDGQTKSAIAGCIVKDGELGIGLLSQGSPSDPAAYPVFVVVDWEAAPVTIRLRRAINGDAELVEINGVAPVPRALLTSGMAPGPIRTGVGTVEFGTASVEAKCTAEYFAFRSELTATSVEDLGPGDGVGRTALLPPFPNPSRGTTQLSFRLKDAGSVQLEIFDVAGRRVRSLMHGHLLAGLHSVAWDGRTDNGRAVESGLYFVRFSSPHGRATSRVTLVR